MRRTILLLAIVFAAAPAAFGQDRPQPYAGQEGREIKALSADEVRALLAGEGMGLARPAELNHYPGPKHVLQLAAGLGLSEAQSAETRKIFGRMRDEAVRLGRQIVERERELELLFARGEISPGRLDAASREIALLQGRLRAAHLLAHVEMKKVLTPAQIKKYDELRGYDSPSAAPHDPSRHGRD